MTTIHKNLINGQWIEANSGVTYEPQNPADLTEVTGIWQKSDAQDTLKAVEAAEQALPGWRLLTVYQRAEFLKKTLSLMRQKTAHEQKLKRTIGLADPGEWSFTNRDKS